MSIQKDAMEAYTYFFPLVFNVQQIKKYAQIGVNGNNGVGFNAFSHATQLADSTSDFVSVNNDTIYSLACIDLSGGPLRLELPETDGRYYMGQFIDAWTNNFAYVGTRGTDGQACSITLLPPDMEEPLDTERTIRFPTTVGVLLMRYAIDGPEDLKNVQRLQQQTTLTPLSPNEPLHLIPEPRLFYESLPFFNEALTYAQQYKASEEDRQKIEAKWTFESTSHMSDEWLNALQIANDTGLNHLREKLANQAHDVTYYNGWDLNLHGFDYNNTFFENGTLATDVFRIDDREKAVETRALSALGGLWGNNAYEAAYFFLWQDAAGEKLLGEHAYTITFDTLPPVKAFWSLTMYNMPEFFLVSNEIGRYSIGDRTEGLHYNADGSLTLYLQAERPKLQEQLANWLPTPKGQFRPILRMYLPKEEVFSPSFRLPPIKKS